MNTNNTNVTKQYPYDSNHLLSPKSFEKSKIKDHLNVNIIQYYIDKNIYQYLYFVMIIVIGLSKLSNSLLTEYQSLLLCELCTYYRSGGGENDSFPLIKNIIAQDVFILDTEEKTKPRKYSILMDVFFHMCKYAPPDRPDIRNQIALRFLTFYKIGHFNCLASERLYDFINFDHKIPPVRQSEASPRTKCGSQTCIYKQISDIREYTFSFGVNNVATYLDFYQPPENKKTVVIARLLNFSNRDEESCDDQLYLNSNDLYENIYDNQSFYIPILSNDHFWILKIFISIGSKQINIILQAIESSPKNNHKTEMLTIYKRYCQFIEKGAVKYNENINSLLKNLDPIPSSVAVPIVIITKENAAFYKQHKNTCGIYVVMALCFNIHNLVLLDPFLTCLQSSMNQSIKSDPYICSFLYYFIVRTITPNEFEACNDACSKINDSFYTPDKFEDALKVSETAISKLF